MLPRVLGVAEPTDPTDVANKRYVDRVAAFEFKGAVVFRSTRALQAVATERTLVLTVPLSGLTDEFDIDAKGLPLVASPNEFQGQSAEVDMGDPRWWPSRILVMNQGEGAGHVRENGVYFVANAEPLVVLQRTSNFGGDGNVVNVGAHVQVEHGNLFAGQGYTLVEPRPGDGVVIPGVDGMYFHSFSKHQYLTPGQNMVIESGVIATIPTPKFRSVRAHTYLSYSDVRLKRNIENFDGSQAMRIICGLKGRRYQLGVHTEVGFLAHEARELMPEVVGEAEGLLAIDYSRIVVPLVEVVKEQQRQIDKLTRLIDGPGERAPA